MKLHLVASAWFSMALCVTALGLLQKSSMQFIKVFDRTSCHHQSLPLIAAGVARTRGFRVGEEVAQQ